MIRSLKGVIPAMVTPRDDKTGEVDLDRLASLTKDLLLAGVHGLFPCSSTGEAPLLSRAQRQAVIETVATHSGSAPVLAGVGSPATATSIELARDAQRAGATHLCILPNHFIPLTDDELYGYFTAIALSTELPVVLYNFPRLCGGRAIPPAIAAKLRASHNVIGIKDSSGDLANMLAYLDECGPEFIVLTGAETLLYPLLAMGGVGTICSAANVYPERLVALYAAFTAGDTAKAVELSHGWLTLQKALGMGTFPAGVKAAMEILGRPVGTPFPPVLPLRGGQLDEARRLIGELPF